MSYSPEQIANWLALKEMYGIGEHTSKLKTLPLTLKRLPSYEYPYQIFLAGPLQSKINIKKEELEEAHQIVDDKDISMFIHSSYLINLCQEPGAKADYLVKLLIKNLECGVAMGAKGVVVHVGKSLEMDRDKALQNMMVNMAECLEYATEECPLLLETPAGQGTETLTSYTEFMEFVKVMDDPRLKICIDTCHIFAAGHDPVSYIEKAMKEGDYVRLIHYNDSKGKCGCCVDRHALPCCGEIGGDTMIRIAEVCSEAGIPMVYE